MVQVLPVPVTVPVTVTVPVKDKINLDRLGSMNYIKEGK